jgi:hypothetical protein
MPSIIAVIEGFVGSVMVCVTAWLRRVRSASIGLRDIEERYIVPGLLLIGLALPIWTSIDERHQREFHPNSSPTVIGLALVLGAFMFGMWLWSPHRDWSLSGNQKSPERALFHPAPVRRRHNPIGQRPPR